MTTQSTIRFLWRTAAETQNAQALALLQITLLGVALALLGWDWLQARRIRRGDTASSTRAWPLAASASALVLVLVCGLIAVAAKRKAVLLLLKQTKLTALDDPMSAWRRFAVATEAGASTFLIAVTMVVFTWSVGAPALALAVNRRARLRGATESAFARIGWPLVGLGVGVLPWLLGAWYYLMHAVWLQGYHGCGDPVKMLEGDLIELAEAQTLFSRVAFWSTGAAVLSVVYVLWHAAPAIARRVLHSWWRTLGVCFGCAVATALLYHSARRYAWERSHPLPTYYQGFGGAYQPGSFEFIGRDFNPLVDAATNPSGGGFDECPEVRLDAKPSAEWHVDGVAVSLDELARVLDNKRLLWTQINPEKHYLACLAFSAGADASLRDFSMLVGAARAWGYQTLYLHLPFTVWHDRPVMGHFRTGHVSALRVELIDRPESGSQVIRTNEAPSYEALVRLIDDRRARAPRVVLTVGE